MGLECISQQPRERRVPPIPLGSIDRESPEEKWHQHLNRLRRDGYHVDGLSAPAIAEMRRPRSPYYCRAIRRRNDLELQAAMARMDEPRLFLGHVSFLCALLIRSWDATLPRTSS